MLAEAERVAREEMGKKSAAMRVFEDRGELVQFYERRGYARTGERMHFQKPGPDEKIRVDKELYFVLLKKDLV